MRPTPLLMIVDDDEDIRELLKLILEGEGYRVTTAPDGLAAYQQITAGELPSLILLDLMMPRMDGEQFLRMLGTSPLAEIPVIVMSGNRADRDKVSELRSRHCLVKPIELDELMDILQRLAPNRSAA